jgi:hypothetical protein
VHKKHFFCFFFFFVIVLQINQACGFWQWVDPKMCSHGERAVGHLREWHVSLIQEAKRCYTMVETDVAKLKANMGIEEAEQCQLIVEAKVAKSMANMEIENVALRKEIEIQEINYQTMKMIYKTIILCTRILIIVYLFIAGSESKGIFNCRRDRMLLP